MSFSEWREVELEEVIELVIDYRGKTPKKLGGDWSQVGYRALSAKNIKTGRIVQEDAIRYLDSNLYTKWMKEKVNRGDILMTSEAPFGELLHWDSDEKIVLSQRLFCLRTNKKVDSKYLYYYMTTNRFQKELDARATGTTVRGLRQPQLLKCKIEYPPIKDQEAIANILSSMDEKIRVNNQINKNLENMAQAIFKQWFVDFEFPNEDGEPYKSSGGEMVESELGKIPKGWKVSKVGELTDIVSKGTTPRKSDIDSAPDNSCVNFLKVKDISDNGVIDLKGLELIPSSVHLNQLKRSILKYKDVLISIAGTIGKISYVNEELVNANTNQAVAFIRLKNVDKHFLLLHYKFKSSNFQDSIKSKIVQGVQANISLSVIKGEKLILPEDNLLGLYNNILNNIFNKSNILCKEINSLTNIRDALLPKLMSGEIRVPLNEKGDAS